MAIVKSIQTNNITNLDRYILDGDAHNKALTNARNLYVDAHNLRKDYGGHYDSMYIASQNYAVRKQANKVHKKTQGYHLIMSFSDHDFPLPKNDQELNRQAKQAFKLVNDWMKQEFPDDSQYLIGIQRDGKGEKLHAHVALNSVRLNGQVIDTNQLSINHKITLGRTVNKVREHIKSKGLAERTQDYMADNFKKVTGRSYQRVPFNQSDLIKSNEKQISLRGSKSWKDELKDELVELTSKSTSLDDFVANAKSVYGIDITKHRACVGVDENGKKKYREAFTYVFKDSTGQSHKTRDFRYTKKGAVRGLGTDYTPQSLQHIIELQNQQQKQVQSEKLDEINNILDSTPNVINNNTKEVDNNGEEQIQSKPREPELKPNVKRVKQVKIDKSGAEEVDTSEYDKHTAKLQQRNQQEADRRNAEISRKLQDDERKRKKHKRLQRSNNQEAQRHHQGRELLTGPDFASFNRTADDLEQSSRSKQHDEGYQR